MPDLFSIYVLENAYNIWFKQILAGITYKHTHTHTHTNMQMRKHTQVHKDLVSSSYCLVCVRLSFEGLEFTPLVCI